MEVSDSNLFRLLQVIFLNKEIQMKIVIKLNIIILED